MKETTKTSGIDYLNMPAMKKLRLLRLLVESLNGLFTYLNPIPGSGSVPTLMHIDSGLKFQYIPSGEFVMGISKAEEKAALRLATPVPFDISQMRPTRRIFVNHFLISRTPILNRDYFRIGKKPFRELQDQFPDDPDVPAWVTYDEALRFGAKLGCRLPEEAEWEYACRATRQSLFVWGDTVPSDEQLEKWLSDDFSGCAELRCNIFGLYGLFMGEWCQGEFRESYDSAAPIRRGEHVVRGGGALFWPWQQGCRSWPGCMCAVRTPDSRLLNDRRGRFRLVYQLPLKKGYSRRRRSVPPGRKGR